MADLTSSKSKINDSEVSDNAPLSEALNVKYGANINYLIDTTDDHETRITANETQSISQSSQATSSTTSATDVTMVSTSITPSSAYVMIMCKGTFGAIGAPSYTATFKLKRGSTVLETRTIVVTGGGSTEADPQDLNFFDGGATPSSSNTYSLTANVTSGGTATWSNLQITVMEPK